MSFQVLFLLAVVAAAAADKPPTGYGVPVGSQSRPVPLGRLCLQCGHILSSYVLNLLVVWAVLIKLLSVLQGVLDVMYSSLCISCDILFPCFRRLLVPST